jgi:putative aminopeptidase FrvX
MTDWASLLKTLTAVPGISGHEGVIARHMAEQFGAYTPDVHIDPIYNVIARFGTGARRIAVCAHLDTIGLMVKKINPDGTLGVVRVGGINLKAAPGVTVHIHTHNRVLPGMIGVRSAHLAQPGDDAVKADTDLYIDTGGVTDDIEITNPICYAPAFQALGDHCIAAPYLDDRAGCAVLLALAAALKPDSAATSVYLIGTVQEETNAMGAYSALAACAPDTAIFIDGTVSYDTPDTRGRGDTRLGGGVVLTSFLYLSGIGGWHAHPEIRADLIRTARKHNIPFQQDAVHGLMADARATLPLGIRSALLGIPMRGKHAALEMLDTRDLDATLTLLRSCLDDRSTDP